MSRITSYDDWIAYMKSIATAHKLFNPQQLAESDHFYPFSEELAGNNLNSPALVLMPDEFGVSDNKSNNIHLVFNPEFWVSTSVAKGDAAGEKAGLKLCFDLAWDILSHISEQYNELGFNPDKTMNYFDPNSIHIQEHQPYGPDRMIGYRVMLSFSNPKHLKKSNNWW